MLNALYAALLLNVVILISLTNKHIQCSRTPVVSKLCAFTTASQFLHLSQTVSLRLMPQSVLRLDNMVQRAPLTAPLQSLTPLGGWGTHLYLRF